MRKWFQRLSKDELTIEELIVLERYPEAEALLRARLSENTHDRQARARLGDVLSVLERHDDAVDCYVASADAFRDDGFFDKAAAILTKAARLAPHNPGVQIRLAEVQDSRSLEYIREEALEGLRAGTEARGGTATLELETIWNRIEASDFPRRIPHHHIKRLLAAVEPLKVATGDVVRSDGDTERELYIVGSAEIAVYHERGSEEVHLINYAAGDIFGESTLLRQETWKGRYHVVKPGALLRLDRSSYEQTLVDNSDPRGLIDALRAQGHDAQLRETLYRILTRKGH